MNIHDTLQATRAEDQERFSVLVVDDEHDIAATLKRGLESVGPFTVHAFTDPLEALKSMGSSHYHLLLIDVRMPKMDGFDFCQKALEVDQDTIIVFLTAAETYIEEYRKRYPKLNGHGFIIKPISIAKISKFLLSELGVSPRQNSRQN